MGTLKLDAIMIRILQGISEGKSMDEIRQAIQDQRTSAGIANPEFRSIGSVYRRVKELEEANLVDPPARPKMARSRKLTDKGKEVLHVYIPQASTQATSADTSGTAGSPT